MSFCWLAAVAATAIVATATMPALAGPVEDKSAILLRFHDWTAAFNARDSVGVCDLFAPDLSYTIPEVVDGTQATMCGNLARLLARPDIRVSYTDPAVHEIILDGNLAVVRLTWTLTTEVGQQKDTTTEEGIDIFGRQPDGRWSIIRFMAFTTSPNKLLK